MWQDSSFPIKFKIIIIPKILRICNIPKHSNIHKSLTILNSRVFISLYKTASVFMADFFRSFFPLIWILHLVIKILKPFLTGTNYQFWKWCRWNYLDRIESGSYFKITKCTKGIVTQRFEQRYKARIFFSSQFDVFRVMCEFHQQLSAKTHAI